MNSRIAKNSRTLAEAPEFAPLDEGSGVLVLEDVAEFYTSRHRSLFGQAFAMVRNRALAEDLTQETFARLVAEIKSGSAIQSAVRWTSTVLRNLALNHLEHRKVASRVIEPDSQAQIELAPGGTPSAEETYLAKESRARLETACRSLRQLNGNVY